MTIRLLLFAQRHFPIRNLVSKYQPEGPTKAKKEKAMNDV